MNKSGSFVKRRKILPGHPEQKQTDPHPKATPLPSSIAESTRIKDGEDVLLKLHGKPYAVQVEEAERPGLGSREYELIETK